MIKEVNEAEKKIKVEIPLTTHTGKIRIKERNSYKDFGKPIPTRKKPFNERTYIEWQIGYDIGIEKIGLTYLKNETLTFKNYSGKEKTIYELSEYIYYFYKWNTITTYELNELIDFIKGVPDKNLFENIYKIQKKELKKVKINNISFYESSIEYPHLIYKFPKSCKVIAEITIREKQKAVGIQPMLYICFPITCLKDSEAILNRTARPKEKAILEIDHSKTNILKDCFKIFGMLSKSHKHDTLEILNLIKERGK
ncbi:R.Pab1 family restriction endonuclease [Thermovibrio sp.]